jgi:hypothetical protein
VERPEMRDHAAVGGYETPYNMVYNPSVGPHEYSIRPILDAPFTFDYGMSQRQHTGPQLSTAARDCPRNEELEG